MLKDILSTAEVVQWINLLRDVRNVVVVSHFAPDGDAIGSSLGLAGYLHAIGKKVRVVMPNCFPDFLHWIPRAEHILTYDRHTELAEKVIGEADLICCLDFNTLKRLELFAPVVERSKAKLIVIDHHQHPDNFADLMISRPDLCSTSGIVFRLIWQLGGYDSMTEEMATALYTGMMTDTGGFTYNSNNPEIFFIISQLLLKNIDKDRIYRNVFHNYSVNRLRLMGYIMHEKLTILADGKASLFTLTKEEQERFSYIRGDSEGLINMPLTIKTVQLSISLREDTDRQLIRVSLRSEDKFPCNRLAADYFNGGGHYNASGGSLSCSMEEAIAVVHQAVEAYKDLL